MSQRSREHRARQTNIPWAIVAIGAVLLVLAAFLILRQAGPSHGGTPRIEVDQQAIDFGYVKLGEPRSFKIVVTNTGDGVLRFNEKPYIEVLEGC